MYQMGDSKLEVRELLVKAFASAWEAGDKTVDRDTYINSSINVIDSLQVGPEMIYGEEGQGLLDAELDHLPEAAFSMTGDVDEVRKKARDMGVI